MISKRMTFLSMAGLGIFISLVLPLSSDAIRPGYYPPQSGDRQIEINELLKDKNAIHIWIEELDKIKIFGLTTEIPESSKNIWQTREQVADGLKSLPARKLLLAYVSSGVMWYPEKSEALAGKIDPFVDHLNFQRTVVLGYKQHDDGHTFMNPSNGVGPVGIRIFSDTANEVIVVEPNHKVLNPNRFMGRAKIAYEAAASCPEILEHLFSYGGDDLTERYTCLLDCFRSSYGADDTICQDEAILAASLFKKNVNLAEIQRVIDQKFSNLYPFKDDSPALKKYKATRLWDKKRVPQSGR